VEELGINGRVISDNVSKTEDEKRQTGLLWLRIENMVMHLQFPYIAWNFLTIRGTVSFTKMDSAL
jgi:hypothetical protein